MIKLTKDDVTIDMPHLMGLKYEIYKSFVAYSELAGKAQAIKDRDEKNLAMMGVQAEMIKIIDMLVAEYPQYKTFSKDFSFVQHMKAFQSMSKGMNKIDLTEELSGDFLEK